MDGNVDFYIAIKIRNINYSLIHNIGNIYTKKKYFFFKVF